MNDNIIGLLVRAAPTVVSTLDLDRARREGRVRVRRRRGVAAVSTTLTVLLAAVVLVNWDVVRGVSVDPQPAGSNLTSVQVAAGCVVVPAGDVETRRHFEAVDAPAAEMMYEVLLPAGGDHLAMLSGVPAGVSREPLDVRAVVHNLEHGAVAIWIDRSALSLQDQADIAVWADMRHRQGFSGNSAGAGLLVSPVPSEGFGAAAVSFRAWGVAIDCDRWNPAAADDFLAGQFGTRGDAPEGAFGPYPTPDPLA